jgi:hypothetical protein
MWRKKMKTSEEINLIVNNLAEKIGMAVDQVTPIAQTMVEEVYRSNLIACGIVVVIWVSICSIVAWIRHGCLAVVKEIPKPVDAKLAHNWICGSLVLVSTVICFAHFATHLMNAFAPTLTLLERIK